MVDIEETTEGVVGWPDKETVAMGNIRIVQRGKWFVPQYRWLWWWDDFGGEHGPTEFLTLAEAIRFAEKVSIDEKTEVEVWRI